MAKTTDNKTTLETAVTAARDGLKRALQALRAHGTDDQGTLFKLENEFEAAKNALEKGKLVADHLANAIGGLQLAEAALANHSLPDPGHLTAVREAHAAAKSALTTLTKNG